MIASALGFLLQASPYLVGAGGVGLLVASFLVPNPLLKAVMRCGAVLPLVGAIWLHGYASGNGAAAARAELEEARLRIAMLERVISNKNAAIERGHADTVRIQGVAKDLAKQVIAYVDESEAEALKPAPASGTCIPPWNERDRAARARRLQGSPAAPQP